MMLTRLNRRTRPSRPARSNGMRITEQTTFRDNFNRADNASLGSDWNEIETQAAIVSNQVHIEATGVAATFATTPVTGNPKGVFVEFDVLAMDFDGNPPGTSFETGNVYAIVGDSSSNILWYVGIERPNPGDAGWLAFRNPYPGSYIIDGAGVNPPSAPSVPAKMRVEMRENGSDLVIALYWGGVLVASGTDASIGLPTSTYLGFRVRSYAGAQTGVLDNFRCGRLL